MDRTVPFLARFLRHFQVTPINVLDRFCRNFQVTQVNVLGRFFSKISGHSGQRFGSIFPKMSGHSDQRFGSKKRLYEASRRVFFWVSIFSSVWWGIGESAHNIFWTWFHWLDWSSRLLWGRSAPLLKTLEKYRKAVRSPDVNRPNEIYRVEFCGHSVYAWQCHICLRLSALSQRGSRQCRPSRSRASRVVSGRHQLRSSCWTLSLADRSQVHFLRPLSIFFWRPFSNFFYYSSRRKLSTSRQNTMVSIIHLIKFAKENMYEELLNVVMSSASTDMI